MTDARNIADDAALGWIVRLREPDFDDWDGLESWLLADPANAAAYHRLADAERRLDPLFAPAPAAVPAVPVPSPRRARRLRSFFSYGTAAAAVVAAILSGRAMRGTADLYEVRTRPGEQREVMLAGGTSVRLNGATIVRLDHDDPRFAALERGEAMFAVRHDASHPFTVRLGDDRLVDLGTRFDIVRTSDRTEVSVAEGAVLYNPRRERVRLQAGDTLRIAGGRATLIRGGIAPDEVGAWRSGRFIYDGDPLSRVTADLARYTGARIMLDPALAHRTFRGVINVPGSRDLVELGPLLNVRIRRTDHGWLISPT
jgi:transmembrane sensor